MREAEEREPKLETKFSVTPIPNREGMGGRVSPNSVSVRPWTCARVRITVKPGSRGKRNRYRKLKEDKEMLARGLCRSPYMQLSWVCSDDPGMANTSPALMDTGADWSLINESQLTELEQAELKPVDIVGQGVTSDELTILGAVWRSFNLGETTIPSQRFVVVKDMVADVILGADFFARLGAFEFDFSNGRFKAPQHGIDVSLHDSAVNTTNEEGAERETVFEVNTASQVSIPPMTELLVDACIDSRLRDGEQVFLNPGSDDGSSFRIPYCVSAVHSGNLVKVRVANVSSEVVELNKGARLGLAYKEFSICPVSPAGNRGNDKSIHAELKKMCSGKLSKQQGAQMMDLLSEFQDVFYQGGELRAVNVGVEHRVRVKTDAPPMAQRPRRLSPEEEAEVRKEIEELREMGVIRESHSAWAAPIVCARRKNGALRLAIDYRRLNAVSLPATMHPIPRIDDLFDRLGEAKYFSILDAKSGYHQLPLSKEESELTAFVVPWGQFEFADVTPFGLKGAGYSFQRFMSTILGESNYTDALCYLDDVLVWGRSWEEHQDRLRRVLTKIREAQLKLSLSKCKFGEVEVEYLGTTIHHGMLSISEQRVEVLRNLPAPTSVTELRSALGAFAFVQRWLPGLAEISAPLYKVCSGKSKKQLEWGPEQEAAFDKLKELSANAVQLKIPDLNKEFVLVTDGSKIGSGALLAQRSDRDAEVLVPVAFLHHALTVHERKYNTTDKELLAVVLSLKKFRVYLGKRFRLITDHKAVRFLNTLNANDEQGRRGRWVEFLQQFDMDLVHRSGNSYELSVADYLSRVSASGFVPEGRSKINMVISKSDGLRLVGNLFDKVELREAQMQDPVVSSWISLLKEGKFSDDGDGKWIRRMAVGGDGILRIKYCGGRRTTKKPWGVKESYRVVIPKNKVKDVLQFIHDSPSGGHMGILRTFRRGRELFWWKEMHQDVTDHVKGCEQCGKNKFVNHPNVAPLQLTDIPNQILDRLQVDFLGPFTPSTAHEYLYALQIQDILSRYVVFIPTQDSTALTAATAVYEDWLLKFGPPSIIQSDQGRHFSAEVFEEMCKLAGVKHKMGAPGHAESQGQVERQNQLMMQVRCLAKNNADDWPRAMLRVAFVHNTSVNETTGYAPYELLFGQDTRTMEKVVLREPLKDGTNKTEDRDDDLSKHVSQVSSAKEAMVKVAQTKILAAQKERSERCFSRGEKYCLGDVVRIKLNTAERAKLGGKKMAPLYSDPYTVVELLGQGWTYKLESINGMTKPKVRHYNDLKEVQRFQLKEDGLETLVIKLPSPEDEPATEPTDSEEEEMPEAVVPLRRTTRQRHPVQRLEMMESSGKRYSEKAVPLMDDGVCENVEEQQ